MLVHLFCKRFVCAENHMVYRVYRIILHNTSFYEPILRLFPAYSLSILSVVYECRDVHSFIFAAEFLLGILHLPPPRMSGILIFLRLFFFSSISEFWVQCSKSVYFRFLFFFHLPLFRFPADENPC